MSGTGTIITRSYTSDAQIPIPDVGILFFENNAAGGQTLLAVRVSDASGKTAPVSVTTPDLAESQSPVDENSWTSVDIVASHRNFGRIVVQNVQVFPNTVTLQELQFVPSDSTYPPPDETERFNITPQPLY